MFAKNHESFLGLVETYERHLVQQRLFLAPRVLCQTALPNPAPVFGMAGREIATRRGQLTVTPSKLVFLRASRKSFSHNTSLYRKSDIVWLRWKCRILRATCFTARATVQIPSYVYPWNLEYSLPRLESYSYWYWSGVCIREKTRFEICISRRNRRDLWRERERVSKRDACIIYVWHFRSLRARLNAIFDNSLEMCFRYVNYVTSSRYASSTDSSVNPESIFP